MNKLKKYKNIKKLIFQKINFLKNTICSMFLNNF